MALENNLPISVKEFDSSESKSKLGAHSGSNWAKGLWVGSLLLGVGLYGYYGLLQAEQENVIHQSSEVEIREEEPTVKLFTGESLSFVREQYEVQKVEAVAPVLEEAVVESAEEKLSDFFEVIIRGEANDNKLNLLYSVVAMLPENQASRPERVVLRYDDAEAPRGLGGMDTIILRATEVDDEEFVSLFVHELGHSVDLGLLAGVSGETSDYQDGQMEIYTDDPSLDFYILCWTSEKEQNELCKDADFVSGYAQTDVFEDFAESYLAYVLHGKEFRALTNKSDILMKKYNFFKMIFDGREFETGLLGNVSSSRPWDETLLPLDNSVLASASVSG